MSENGLWWGDKFFPYRSFDLIVVTARRYINGLDSDILPINPVVRREDGQWSIESELIPAPDCDFECSLDGFCEYWFSDGDDIKPDESDIAYWISQFDFE
jgi:hypothetical protein